MNFLPGSELQSIVKGQNELNKKREESKQSSTQWHIVKSDFFFAIDFHVASVYIP